MSKTKKAKEGRTLGEWHTGGIFYKDGKPHMQNVYGPTPEGAQSGEIICANVLIEYAERICLAVNSHDELVEALEKASELINSLHEMTRDGNIDKNSHVGPSLTLKTAVRKLAPELAAALARVKKSTGGEG